MKFTASIKDLAQALGHISGATPQRSPMPVLENILLELDGPSLSLTATDMDITMTTRLQVTGEGDGRILIPAKRLSDTVRALDKGDLTIDVDLQTKRVSLQTASGQYKLSGLDADEFPQLPEFAPKATLKLPAGKFTKMVERTVFACSTDEFRPSMTGVLFQFRTDEVRAVSTDGFRLVRVIDREVKPGTDGLDIIVPPKALQLSVKAFSAEEVTLEAGETHVRFSDGTSTVVARLIDEQYPNYESVIPQVNDKRMVVRRDDLLGTVKRVSIYSNLQTRQLRLKLTKDTIRVQAEDIDTSSEAFENIPCDYGDEDIEIGFNSLYVREALDRIEADEITFDFSTPLRPSVLTPNVPSNGQDVMMLLMPVRLNN